MKKKMLIILAIFTILLISVLITNALYRMSEKGKAEITVASPQVRLIEQTTNIEELDLKTYTNEFKVVNFDENGKCSDVQMDYKLMFELSDKDAPIDIELYKIDTTGKESKIILDSNLKTVSNYNLKAKTIQEDNYKLKIKYNLEDTKMDNNIDVKINLKSMQIQ